MKVAIPSPPPKKISFFCLPKRKSSECCVSMHISCILSGSVNVSEEFLRSAKMQQEKGKRRISLWPANQTSVCNTHMHAMYTHACMYMACMYMACMYMDIYARHDLMLHAMHWGGSIYTTRSFYGHNMFVLSSIHTHTHTQISQL